LCKRLFIMNIFRRIIPIITIACILSLVSMPFAAEKGTLSARNLTKILLKAEGSILKVGETRAIRAVGVYADRSQADITAAVQWISRREKVARFTAPGILVGVAPGNVYVIAKYNGKQSAVMRLRVDPSEEPVLKLNPQTVDLGNIERNTTEEFTVTIRNAGKKDLHWKLYTDQPWLVPAGMSVEQHKRRLRGLDKDLLATVGTGKLGVVMRPAGREHSGQNSDDEPLPHILVGRKSQELHFSVLTEDLPDGEYQGTIIIRSTGGVKQVDVTMKVVSLTAISLNPVSISIGVGQRRTFRAIGTWSDGSRTDLSDNREGMWVVSDHSVGSFLLTKPVFVADRTGQVEIRKIRGEIESNSAIVNVEEFIAEPVLFISPREIDLGTIGPGENSEEMFSLRNIGSQRLSWSSEKLQGWNAVGTSDLSGTLERSPRYVRVNVESLATQEQTSDESERPADYHIVITMETRNRKAIFKKYLPPGTYREMVTLNSDGGTRHLFLKFAVAEVASKPHLALEPAGIDMSAMEVGKRQIRKIKLQNMGKDVLKWNVALRENRRSFAGIPLKRGRYICLYSARSVNRDVYLVPKRLKDTVYISGRWFQDNGFPSSNGESNSLKVAFWGTGISVFLWKDVEGGSLSTSIDDRFTGTIECDALERKRFDFSVAEDLPEGSHVLTLVGKDGNVSIDGLKIYGENLMKGKKGWIRVYPEKGTTTKETDYVNVMINTQDLHPGNYTENLLFASNGGTGIVDISLEVIDNKYPKIINVYRYKKGNDYLFTATPDAENPELFRGYRRQRVAFKLFRKGTFGTTEFFRWYNPVREDHFYSYDRDGGGKRLDGYYFEGTIGNIATSRLSGTKELYRWYNPVTGTHFYSTDPKGEGLTEKEYKYDGIAGYVK